MPCVRLFALVLMAMPLAACSAKPSAAEQAREDARAVAMVEAAQKVNPPPVSLTPLVLSTADLATYRLAGSGCRLTAIDGLDPGAVMVANSRRALLRLTDRIVTYAADGGSGELIPDVRRHYVGKAHSLTLERGASDGTDLGSDELRWPAVLTIRDAWNQIVFTGRGQLVC